ncbi:MAG: carbohydrate kinase family protein [Acidimicrobiia bacterium]|nr:carbohydrate kinase family protein [Acidimicrobiia bacterium]
MTVLVYGAANPDIVHHVDRLPGPGDDIRSDRWFITWGGKAANAAVALATWGIETRLTGLVAGLDPLGDALAAALERPHLDLARLERASDEATRHCLVLVDPRGDRTIVCAGYEGARWSAVSTWEGIEIVLLDGFAGQAAAAVAAEARSRSVPVVWLDCPVERTGLADWVVWSAHEHTVDEARASGAGFTVLTAGAGEIVTFGAGEWRVAPPEVEVVDATGAGDVFAAACARGLYLGWDPERTVRWAAAAGAALAAHGRTGGLPPTAAIDPLSEIA